MKAADVAGTDKAWVIHDPTIYDETDATTYAKTGVVFHRNQHGNYVGIDGNQINVVNKTPSDFIVDNFQVRSSMSIPGEVSISNATVTDSLKINKQATADSIELIRPTGTSYNNETATGNLNVQGISTFSSWNNTNIPHLHATNLKVTSSDANTGVSTFAGNVRVEGANRTFKVINSSDVTKFTIDTDNGNTDIVGNLDVDGDTTLDKTDIAGNLTVVGRADIDNIRINGNTISSLNTNGAITLDPNGTGDVNIQGPVSYTHLTLPTKRIV